MSKSHTIRFPDDLYEELKKMAQEDRRTFNSEVVWLLDQARSAVNLGQLQITLQERKEQQKK